MKTRRCLLVDLTLLETEYVAMDSVSLIKRIKSPDRTEIFVSEMTSPLGDMVGCSTSDGIFKLTFGTLQNLKRQIEDHASNPKLHCSRNSHLQQLAKELDEYFSGQRKAFEVAIDVQATEFRTLVWRKLKNVPYGDRITYLQQAEMVGNPKAVRAVAAANGKNPIAVVLPCHRVVGVGGNLTGYAWGLDRKRWLLDFERSNLGSNE